MGRTVRRKEHMALISHLSLLLDGDQLQKACRSTSHPPTPRTVLSASNHTLSIYQPLLNIKTPIRAQIDLGWITYMIIHKPSTVAPGGWGPLIGKHPSRNCLLRSGPIWKNAGWQNASNTATIEARMKMEKIIFKCWKKRTVHTESYIQKKMSFRNKREIKPFSDERQLRDFPACIPTHRKWLKEVL